MADWNLVSQPESFALQFERLAAQLRCALPGIILEFDPASQTAVVQPALKMKLNLGDRQEHIDLPPIPNTPVLLPFAQKAGLLLTLPLAPGDECLLVFCDRAIDNFVQNGGIQPAQQGRPAADNSALSAPRAHSLSDAVCIPGLISAPQAVPAYSQSSIELRDRNRQRFISLGPDGVQISDGSALWKMQGGKLDISAPGGINISAPGGIQADSPQTSLSGQLTARELSLHSGTTMSTHVHAGVETGPDRSGPPV